MRTNKAYEFAKICSLILVPLLAGCSSKPEPFNLTQQPKPWIKFDGGNCELGRRERATHKQLIVDSKRAKPDVLFIGDSITGQWCAHSHGIASWNRYFKPLNAFNSGVAGANTQFTLWHLNNGAVEGINPRIVVLMVGSNNLLFDTPEETIPGIVTVVQSIQTKLPATKILLLGILPRSITTEDLKSKDFWLRKNIRQINNAAATLESHNVHFLDLGDCVLDKRGLIDTHLMPDGVHPSAAAYEIMSPIVRKSLDLMLASPTK